MTKRDSRSEEEFSFAELVWILFAHGRWVAGVPLSFALVALVVSLFLPRQWQASVAVQVGQVGHVALTGPSSEYLEPVPRAVERMKLRPFQDAVLSELGIPTDGRNPDASLYRDSLKVRQLQSTDVIEIRVRGLSREEAKRMAEATVRHLRDVHNRLGEPSIKRLRQQLAEVREQIDKNGTQQDQLALTAEGRNRAGVGFPEKLLFDNMIHQLILQRRDLELRALAYEENLGPLRTYETAALDKVFVDDSPAAPRTVLYVAVAGLLGLCLGVFVALAMNAMKVGAERDSKRMASPTA